MKIDKENYPKTPDFIKNAIEDAVYEHLDTKSNKKHSKLQKYVVAVILATLCIGTTVYAASKLLTLTTEKKGNYGLETKVSATESTASDSSSPSDSASTTENIAYSDDRYELQEETYVSMEINYLPDDMYIQVGNAPKVIVESTSDKGNRRFSFTMMKIPEGVEVTNEDTSVISSQEFSVDDGSGVAIELASGYKKVYIAYENIGYQLTIHAISGMTNQELIDIAKGLSPTVVTAKEAETLDVVVWAYTYIPPFVAETTTASKPDQDLELPPEYYAQSIQKDELKAVYNIGDEVTLSVPLSTKKCTAKVSNVIVCDDLSPLEPEVMEYRYGSSPSYVDENGKLKDEVITYYKAGDGINTISEPIKTEAVPVKLVYVTIEYSCDEPVDDLLFNHSLFIIEETEDSYNICDKTGYYECYEYNADYDYVGTEYYNIDTHLCFYCYNGSDMYEKNHFTNMKAGETRTAHYGFIVREDELPYMYLDFTGTSQTTSFLNKKALKTGLVDIRQEIPE